MHKIVTVIIDRPLGSYHPEHKDLYYPVNYGYIPGIIALDGEERDAYVLGADVPLETFTGNPNTYIYPARKESFPKTKLARKCIRKLREDEAFRRMYSDCTLDEMVEKAMTNGEIGIEEE